MKVSKSLIAGAFISLAAPAMASGGEMVTFSFMKSELETSDSRQLLLDRITAHSMRACDTGTIFATPDAVRRCADDLREQFIKAIDDDALSLLARSEEKVQFRTARR